MIKVMIIGNLGADAVSKNINRVDYVSFSVAHSVKGSDGTDKTTWVDCLMRGGEKLLPYLRKGQCVWVIGDVDCKIYDSSKYHCKMISWSCFVDNVRLCGAAPKSDNTSDVPSNVDPETGEVLPNDNKPF